MAVSPYYLDKAKKKLRWWFVVDIPSGKYDKFGKQKRKQYRRKGFKRKCDAEEAERKFLSEFKDKGIPIVFNPDIKTGCVVNTFIEYAENEGRYAKGTIINYKGYRNKHMQNLMEVPVKLLTHARIQHWHREIYNAGVSDHVYNGCLKLLKRAFAYCISLKQLTVNPFDDFKPVKIRKKLRNRFSINELKKVIDTCMTEMPEYYCIFILSCLTGMRLGEYSAVRPSDIRKRGDHYVIFVDKQITRNEYKDRTKTDASTRIVHISDNVYDIIQWHIKTFNIPTNDFLFRADKGGMLYAKWVERKFAKLLLLCGYNEHYCRVHDLRGEYVDIMHLCEVPVTYISRQVGQSSPNITAKVYTQILNELPEEANKRMDAMLFGEKVKTKNTKVIAFTGAGISKTAGIPTFEEMSGIKEKLSVAYKKENPEDFQKALDLLKSNVKGKNPTIAHKILAEHNIPIITMNVDGLHQKAGSTGVIEVHGNAEQDNIVLHGEPMLRYDDAVKLVVDTAYEAKNNNQPVYLLVIGTSMQTAFVNNIIQLASAKRMLIRFIDTNADEEVEHFLKEIA